MKYTAHCMSFGYIQKEIEGEGVVLGGLYGGDDPVALEEDVAIEYLNYLEADPEARKTEEMLLNNNYPGRTTNFSELGQANIGYAVGEPAGHEDSDGDLLEDVFNIDTVSFWSDEGENVQVLLNGEMRGFREIPKNSASASIEPLTVVEAAEFIDTVLGTTYAEETETVLKASIASALSVELKTVCERIKDYEEAIFNHNWNLGRESEDGEPRAKFVSKWAGLKGKFNKDGLMDEFEEARHIDSLVTRLKTTVRDDSVGGPWAHQDRYCMGQRNGVIDITKELSVQNRTHMQQYSDDNIILLEKEALDESKPSMYASMFDKDGLNRGFGDRSRYYWRCSNLRERRFIKLQMYILRAPIDVLKAHFSGPESVVLKKYRKSIKECAPGPASRLVSGKWESVPLEGEEAVAALTDRGFDESQLSEDVKFHKGESWHKIWLKKEHVVHIQEMVAARLELSRVQTLAEKFGTKNDSSSSNLTVLQSIAKKYRENQERKQK